jgi:hypothetical protein
MPKKRMRRQFDAAFTVKAIRQMEERRELKVPMTTIARALRRQPALQPLAIQLLQCASRQDCSPSIQ